MKLHRQMNHRLGLALALLSNLLLWGCGNGDPPDIDASPLAPDFTYGQQGKATFPIGTLEGRIGKSVLQPDGKLLVAGWRQTPASEPGRAPSELFVIRVNVDGSPDTQFGTGGELRLTLKGSDTVADMAVQADGRILLAVDASEPCVVTGLFLCTSANGAMASRVSVMLRLSPQGMRDASFGSKGIVEAPASSLSLALGLQTDGRIVLLRSTGRARLGLFGWALARYHPDGAPDPAFNQGEEVPSNCQADEASLLLQPDGAMVVGAVQGVSYGDPTVNPGLCMERLHADGSRDLGFANANLWNAFNTNVSLHALSPLPSKALLAIGRSCDLTNCGFWVSQFDREGRQDPSFGQGGTLQTLLGPTFNLAGSLLTRGGELILLGTHRPNSATQQAQTYQPVWIRLDSTGQAAPGFGVNGVLVQAPETLQAQQLLQDSQGRWLVVSRARMADGGLAVVVNRLRGERQ